MSTEKSDVEIWDSITSGDEQPVTDETPAEEPVVDETPVDEAPAEEEAPVEEGASTDTEGPMESLAAMVGEIKQKLEKPAEEAAKAETKSSTPEPFVDPAERLTEEQKKALEVYDADFPEIKKAVGIEMQMFAERFLNFHHTRETQLVDEIKAALEPLVGMHSEYTAEKKQRTTRQAIPEFDEVSAWIETQPKIVRGAYQTALSEGGDSRAEVLAAFKASRQTKPVLSEAKTKALQGMKSTPKMRAPAVSDSDETQDPQEIWKRITSGG